VENIFLFINTYGRV